MGLGAGWTTDRSSSATDRRPSSVIVVASSSRTSSSSRRTPASPSAASASAVGRPHPAAATPSASGLDNVAAAPHAAVGQHGYLAADLRDDGDRGVEPRRNAVELPAAVVRHVHRRRTADHSGTSLLRREHPLRHPRQPGTGAQLTELLPAPDRAAHVLQLVEHRLVQRAGGVPVVTPPAGVIGLPAVLAAALAPSDRRGVHRQHQPQVAGVAGPAGEADERPLAADGQHLEQPGAVARRRRDVLERSRGRARRHERDPDGGVGAGDGDEPLRVEGAVHPPRSGEERRREADAEDLRRCVDGLIGRDVTRTQQPAIERATVLGNGPFVTGAAVDEVRDLARQRGAGCCFDLARRCEPMIAAP